IVAHDGLWVAAGLRRLGIDLTQLVEQRFALLIYDDITAALRGIAVVGFGSVAWGRSIDNFPRPADQDHFSGLKEIMLSFVGIEDGAAFVADQVFRAANGVSRNALRGCGL